MSNYTKATNFATKDTLPTGDSNKIVKGTEIDNEFNAISGAVSSKADIASPTFTGTPAAPTATAGSNTTQVANTAHVFAERTNTATLTNKTLTSPTINTPTISTPSITGGTITGITDLAVADGGTGASTLAANNVLLGNGTSALQTVAPSTAGNVLTSNGTTWASASPTGGKTQAQLFVSSSSWTAPAGVTRVNVIVVGGGGGYNAWDTNPGGQGGFAHAVVTVSPGTSYTVTVGGGGAYASTSGSAGAGGTSSFGSFLSATGGAGGNGGAGNGVPAGNGGGTISSGDAIRTGNVSFNCMVNGNVDTDGYIIGYPPLTGNWGRSGGAFSTSQTSAAGAGGRLFNVAGTGGAVLLQWVEA